MSNVRYHDIPDHSISLPGITSLIALYAEYKLIDTYIPKSVNMSNIGTQAHALIARINKGGHLDDKDWYTLDKKGQNAIIAFLRWRKDVGFKPREVEALVYSLKYGIAGHPDASGICRPWYIGVFDWKLGDITNIRVKMQVPAYGFCFAEMHPRRRKFDGFRGVHLDPITAGYEELIMTYDEGREYFEMFLALKKKVGII